MPIASAAAPLGAAWLNLDYQDTQTWAHEVGHHRQLEHAGNAAFAEWEDRDGADEDRPQKQHDNAPNKRRWPNLQNYKADQRWDCECIMSYNHSEQPTFCGKCVLRNRGWKVTDIGGPGDEDGDPLPAQP